MVNYRRIVCEVAVLGVLLTLTTAAPTPDCAHSIHYDQRQNGSENYRLNIEGVVVAVAPAESMLSALGDMTELMDLLSLEDFNSEFKPPESSSSSSPSTTIQSIVPVSIEEVKPSPKPEDKPEVKPLEEKLSQENVQEAKPEVPAKPVELSALSDVSLGDDLKIQKKEVSKIQEKTKKLKSRLASFLLPLLRKTRHH